MRIFYYLFSQFYYHVVKILSENKIIKIDINENLTFDEFKNLIEKKGLKKIILI